MYLIYFIYLFIYSVFCFVRTSHWLVPRARFLADRTSASTIVSLAALLFSIYCRLWSPVDVMALELVIVLDFLSLIHSLLLNSVRTAVLSLRLNLCYSCWSVPDLHGIKALCLSLICYLDFFKVIASWKLPSCWIVTVLHTAVGWNCSDCRVLFLEILVMQIFLLDGMCLGGQLSKAAEERLLILTYPRHT